jgi:hypothetical protein
MFPELWQNRIRWVIRLGLLAVLGLALLIPPLILNGDLPAALIVAGLLLVVPGLIYLNLVTIWHWKARYRGSHSDLWGALILIETSGWLKLVYLFRHMIPDARGRGRYARITEHLSTSSHS